ncbi:hypothetical protein HNR42_000789 [Deinobacterium chartae]|uniref:Winged helix DNA-binding domain-containing protein n=1 Tax=Deinobacterium chartae TaxID=521158 RepID=A0A841I062_9DEIO|nr:winged helix DNA-binding domain-containing protein [Deinobacterium chartae]MBB6097375.1 hypothetical protein [Deinobacterium chartae]
MTSRTDRPLPGSVLDRRTLNRALLERQWLLQRRNATPLEAAEHLIGLQAQAPNPPYIGLWSRLEDFAPEDLSRLVSERQAVRLALLRSTLHLVSARDAHALRPLLQPVLERGLRGTFGRALTGVDLEELAHLARSMVEERPCTFQELGRRLGERWPGVAPQALAGAARTALALVQVPPRGLWGASGPAAHTTLESWLGAAPPAQATLQNLVLRYLSAFGPASAQDVQSWCGLSGLRAVLEGLRPQLVTYRDEAGRELFDLPGAPLPDPHTPAPARLVADFDNLLLSHADRSRVISEPDRRRIFTPNGLGPGTVLLDGFVSGTWRLAHERSGATLQITPLRPFSAAEREAVAAEGTRLLEFAATTAQQRALRFLDT